MALLCEVWAAFANGQSIGCFDTRQAAIDAIYKVAQGGRVIRYTLDHSMLMSGEQCLMGHGGTIT